MYIQYVLETTLHGKNTFRKKQVFLFQKHYFSLFSVILALFRLILALFGPFLILFNTQTPKYAGSYRVRFLDISKISGKIS